jgi:hypothetical protein
MTKPYLSCVVLLPKRFFTPLTNELTLVGYASYGTEFCFKNRAQWSGYVLVMPELRFCFAPVLVNWNMTLLERFPEKNYQDFALLLFFRVCLHEK